MYLDPPYAMSVPYSDIFMVGLLERNVKTRMKKLVTGERYYCRYYCRLHI